MKLTTRAENRRRGDGTSRRQRSNEPVEQRRAALQAANRCITCGEPSETQRCAACAAQVEANTERYRGAAVKGPPTKARTDLTDLRYAVVEISAAAALYEQVPSTLTKSERGAAIAGLLAKLALARGFLDDVLRRNHYQPPAIAAGDDDAPGGSDTSRWYFARKVLGRCVRCPRKAAIDSVLCKACRRRERARLRALMRGRRAGRARNVTQSVTQRPGS